MPGSAVESVLAAGFRGVRLRQHLMDRLQLDFHLFFKHNMGSTNIFTTVYDYASRMISGSL